MSWCFLPEDLGLYVIWANFEDFCKPQTNEVRARCDLLTSFRQGSHFVDVWYNALQAKVSLAKYPLEAASILHRDIFWFFLKDKEFVDKFPASKVRQLAKKLESAKSTAKDIKTVASDPKWHRLIL